MTWISSGNSYAGSWQRGLIHGNGRLEYGPLSSSPGDTYKGEFQNGEVGGSGMYTSGQTGRVVKGQFKDNQLICGHLL